jgi:hypothetical protein
MLYRQTVFPMLISSTLLIIANQQNAFLAGVFYVPWYQEGQPLLTDFQFLSVFTLCIIITWLWLSLGPKPFAVNKHIHKDAVAECFGRYVSFARISYLQFIDTRCKFNPLNARLHPTCHLLALLGALHILHVSSIRVKRSTYIQELFVIGRRGCDQRQI